MENLTMDQPIARPMNRRHKAFCLSVSKGMSQTEAYRRFISKKANHPASIACVLVKRFQAHIARLRHKFAIQAEDAGVMSKLEIAQYLSRAARTPFSEIDENSDLCQEKSIRPTEFGDEVKLKSVNKLDAIAQLSKLVGYNEAEKLEVTHTVETPLIRFINGLQRQAIVHDLGSMPIRAYDPLPDSPILALRALDSPDPMPPPANLEPARTGREVVFKSQE